MDRILEDSKLQMKVKDGLALSCLFVGLLQVLFCLGLETTTFVRGVNSSKRFLCMSNGSINMQEENCLNLKICTETFCLSANTILN